MSESEKQPRIDFRLYTKNWPDILRKIFKEKKAITVNSKFYTIYPDDDRKRPSAGEKAATIWYDKGPVAMGNFHLRLTGHNANGPEFELVVKDVSNLMDFEFEQILEQIVGNADEYFLAQEGRSAIK
jgi:hypothetical protein